MNNMPREAEFVGVLRIDEIDWELRVYLMRSNPNEAVRSDALFASLHQKVHIVATTHLSAEFEYLRSGFIIAHYGRRGVTYSVWHWAEWGGTWEYFCQAWYCYGRTTDAMEPLDRTEPILCQHELALVMQEGLSFRDIARRYASREEIIREYRNCSASYLEG